MRWLLAAHEEASFTEAGVAYTVELSPGLGRNVYLHLGCRVASRLTAVVYWDGVRLGRSDEVVVPMGRGTGAIVFQPASRLDVLGLRVTYAI